MKNKTAIKMLCAAALLLELSAFSVPGKEPISAAEAKLLLDVKRAELQKPLDAFQKNYEAALSRIQETEQAKGNLEAILLLKKEKENFRTRVEPPEKSSLPSLNKLQEIYHRELENIKKERSESESIAFAQYRAVLEKIISDLTREGKVDEAIKVRKMLTEIEKVESNSEPAEVSPKQIILGTEENYTITSTLKLEKEDELYVLSSDANANQAINSTRSFKTPFTIQARAMTDGGNIRIYFGQRGIVIFNWEMNPKELRINEPVANEKHGIRDSKPLDPDKLHDLEIQVTESKIGIYVGRRKYGEIKGDFAEAEGTVGIGPAFGSKVSVERFAATQLGQDQ